MTRRGGADAKRLLGRLVLDQFDRIHQTEATHVAHRRMRTQLFKEPEEIPALLGAALRQLLALQDLDVLERRGARHRLTAKGQEMGERHILLLELVEKRLADSDRSDRRVA